MGRKSPNVTVDNARAYQGQMESQLHHLDEVLSGLKLSAAEYNRHSTAWRERFNRLAKVEKGEVDGALWKFDTATMESLKAFRDIAQSRAMAAKESLDRIQIEIKKVRENRDSLNLALSRVTTHNTVSDAISKLGGQKTSVSDVSNIKELLDETRRTVHEANALMELRQGELTGNLMLAAGKKVS